MNDWKPSDPEVLNAQRAVYDDMRERCPVAHSDFMGWSVFRHADIAKVLADTDTYSNVSRFQAIPNGMDPPEHTRYRNALAFLFSAERMDRLEPDLRAIACAQLESLLTTGDAEFVKGYITPFALKAHCAMLGWPEDLWECLADWAHGNQQVAFDADPDKGKALHELLSKHVKANLDAHRAGHGNQNDATAGLLNTTVDGKALDDDQIVSVLRNWTAGHGTVAAGIGILLLHLALDQELQHRLRQDPALIPGAIEEILRVDGPLVGNPRTTTKEVEIQGCRIPKGERLSLMWIAANRDARTFNDAANIDITRDNEASLVWGQGIHVCLGAPLARLEMRVALETLLHKTQRFALAGEAPRREHYPGNGPLELKLSLEC